MRKMSCGAEAIISPQGRRNVRNDGLLIRAIDPPTMAATMPHNDDDDHLPYSPDPGAFA